MNIAVHDALYLPIIRKCSQYRWPLADIAGEHDQCGVKPPWKGGKWSAMAVLRIRKRHGHFPKVEDCLVALQVCCFMVGLGSS